MFKWFKSLFATYRVIHDPELGYVAVHRGAFADWWCLKADGSSGVHRGDAPKFPSFYFVESAEEAGRRINLHATSRGQSVVWEG